MSQDTLKIYYENEDDRAFGLAGMAVTIASLDAIDRIAEIWLDADGPMVSFSNDYYFSGSPSVSPRASWENLIRNFNLTASMAVGNLMARSLVRLGKEIPEDIMENLRKTVLLEGMESCALDEDEVDALLSRSLVRANRIFRNPRLHPAVKALASVISRRRRLSGHELEDELSILQF